ncbi:MAG: hypothetical protein IJO93_05485 [Clostridia bacterium]|nr:hypothetical protein [Clostridia bacterium]
MSDKDKTVTSSVVAYGEESFAAISAVLEKYETELGICDIALLEEYSNIIFDSSKAAAEKVMEYVRNTYQSVYWRHMISDGENILTISTYDETGFSSESIGKSMEEIALESTYSCSGNCSECSGDCHGEHSQGCDCDECKAAEFDLMQTVEMFDEMASGEEGEMLLSTLVPAFFEELERFVNEQTDEDSAEEVYDLFLNMLIQIMLAAAVSDGSYTLREHECIERITGEMEFERTKSALSEMLPDSESISRAMSYWREAEKCGCEVRRLTLMICVYLCSADGKVNEKELHFLESLSA